MRKAAVLAWFFVIGSALAQNSGFTFSNAMGRPRAFPNAPYSAVQETEHTQTLANGTHVVTKRHVRIYRDSAGRTRREMFLPDGAETPHDGPLSITIEDPVASVIYIMQTEMRTAHVLDLTGFPRPALSSNTDAPQPVRTPPNSTLPKLTNEDLGIQTIDGVEAHGRRATRTIPTGAQGNDGPIVVISETWNSPELGLAILVKNSDPRSGDTVTRIINLDRSEPDPSLFQVPSDYTIVNDDKK